MTKKAVSTKQSSGKATTISEYSNDGDSSLTASSDSTVSVGIQPGGYNAVNYIDPNALWIKKLTDGTKVDDVPSIEDYSLYVNLEVEIRSRYQSSTNEASKVYVVSWSPKEGNVSFQQGTRIYYDANSQNSEHIDSLTTDYADYKYDTFASENPTTEMFGIKSIDVNYDNFYVPQVTIQFVDIRGMSLFSPTEDSHNRASVDKDGTTITGIQNPDIGGSFFRSFFTFPYPMFRLKLKGFYGQPISYELNCTDWKANFDCKTGNFGCTATFIGYSFALISDITFNILCAAPLTSVGSEYWQTRGGAINQNILENGSSNDLSSADTNASSAETSDDSVDDDGKKKSKKNNKSDNSKTISKKAKKESDAKNEKTETEPSKITEGAKASKSEPTPSLKIATPDNSDIYGNGDPSPGEFVYANGDGTMKTFKEFLDDVNTGQINAQKAVDSGGQNKTIANNSASASELDKITTMFTTLCNDFQTAYGKVNNMTVTGNSSMGWVIAYGTSNQVPNLTKIYKERDDLAKEINSAIKDKIINDIDSSLVSNSFIYDENFRTKAEMNTRFTGCTPALTALNAINSKNSFDGINLFPLYQKITEETKNITDSTQTANDEIGQIQQSSVATAIGFTPCVQNFIKMICAHIETLIYLINQTVKEIDGINNGNQGSRTIQSMNLSDSDVEDGKSVPPFPKITKVGKDGKIEDGWIGDVSGEDTPEAKLVMDLLSGSKILATAVKQDTAIDGGGADGGGAAEDSDIAEEKTAIPRPVCPIDLWNTDSKGMFGNIDGKTDIKTVGILLLARYAIIARSWPNGTRPEKYKDFGLLDAYNFQACFPDASTPMAQAMLKETLSDSNFMTTALNTYLRSGKSSPDDIAYRNYHKQDIYVQGNPNDRFKTSTVIYLEDLNSKYKSTLGRIKGLKNSGKDNIFNMVNLSVPKNVLSKYESSDVMKTILDMGSDDAYGDKKLISFSFRYGPFKTAGNAIERTGYNVSIFSIAHIFVAFSGDSADYDKMIDRTLKRFCNMFYAYGKGDECILHGWTCTLIMYGIYLLQRNVRGDAHLAGVSSDCRNLLNIVTDSGLISKDIQDKCKKMANDFSIDLNNRFMDNSYFKQIVRGKNRIGNFLSGWDNHEADKYGIDIDDNSYDVLVKLLNFKNNRTQWKTVGNNTKESLQKIKNKMDEFKNFLDKELFSRFIVVNYQFVTFDYTDGKYNIYSSNAGSNLYSYRTAFLGTIQKLYKGQTADNSSNTSSNADTSANNTAPSVVEQEEPVIDISSITEAKIAMYNYLKIIYDRWLCGKTQDELDEWKLENFYGKRFKFIDSYYYKIGQDAMVNPLDEAKRIKSSLINESYSVPSFIQEVLSHNNMIFMCIQNFLDMSDGKAIADAFKPYPYESVSSITPHSDFICMYTYETSHNSGMNKEYENEDNKNIGDSFLLSDDNTIAMKAPVAITSKNASNGYSIPCFGVTFGKQYQSYFTDIEVNMDSPVVTEQVVKTQFSLGNMAGTPKGDKYIGQDLFTIYSNNSYTCSVTSLGCGWIQPTMYFCLNNIPLFRGTYMIFKVSHHIEQGKFTTKFSGNRLSRIATPLVKAWCLAGDGQSADEIEAKKHKMASPDNDCPYAFNDPASMLMGMGSLKKIFDDVNSAGNVTIMGETHPLNVWLAGVTTHEMGSDNNSLETKTAKALTLICIANIYNITAKTNRNWPFVLSHLWKGEGSSPTAPSTWWKTPLEYELTMVKNESAVAEAMKDKRVTMRLLQTMNQWRGEGSIRERSGTSLTLQLGSLRTQFFNADGKDKILWNNDNNGEDSASKPTKEEGKLNKNARGLYRAIKATCQSSDSTSTFTLSIGKILTETSFTIKVSSTKGSEAVFDAIALTYFDFYDKLYWYVSNNDYKTAGPQYIGISVPTVKSGHKTIAFYDNGSISKGVKYSQINSKLQKTLFKLKQNKMKESEFNVYCLMITDHASVKSDITSCDSLINPNTGGGGYYVPAGDIKPWNGLYNVSMEEPLRKESTPNGWLGTTRIYGQPDEYQHGKPHLGIDFSYGGKGSATVYAVADGKLVFYGTNSGKQLNRYIVVRHDKLKDPTGKYCVFSIYMHCHPNISVGSSVNKGQPIGATDYPFGPLNTGTGSHCHFEILLAPIQSEKVNANANTQDPGKFIHGPSQPQSGHRRYY